MNIHGANDAAVTFDNVWLHRAFILVDDDSSPRNFTINTTVLLSSICWTAEYLSACITWISNICLIIMVGTYIAGDQTNIGLLLLHSDADLTVASYKLLPALFFFKNITNN